MNWGILQKLLDLYAQFKPLTDTILPGNPTKKLVEDLLAIINEVVEGISQETGMSNAEIFADNRLRLDKLDADLIKDLQH